MTRLSENKINLLIDRFMAGETSNAEEAELMDYFRSDDLPPAHRQLRYMMMFYDNKLTEPTPAAAPQPRIRRFRLRRWQWISTAAAVALIVTVAVSFIQRQQLPNEYLVYSGSYIIRDGKKITDIPTILPELKKAERIALEQQSKVDHEVAASLDLTYQDISEVINLDDPLVRSVYLEAIGSDEI